MNSPRLPFESDASQVDSRLDARDRASRARAVDPSHNVVLEASAGTGKTRVLVDRYVNLLRAGVDPSNILAMTFTRKAAAEMRERILATLRAAALRGEIPPARWRELQDRTGEVAIGTIDAFCLSLLREFPLEADLDPGFTVADETEAPRLVDEALDRAVRVCRAVAQNDAHVALVFAQLGNRRVRAGLAALLARRSAVPRALRRFLGRAGPELTIGSAATRAAAGMLDALADATTVRLKPDTTADWTEPAYVVSGFSRTGEAGERRADALRAFAASGPAHPSFMLLVQELETLETMCRSESGPDPVTVRVAVARVRDYFLTADGGPRVRLIHPKTLFPSSAHWARHRDMVTACAPRVAEVLAAYRRDLNVLVARGVWRMFRVAETEYRRTLDAHAALDFSDLLARTLHLLRQMEEFARSRYRLESRYHHVLLDEFQDTSRAQWELVSLLVQSWGEGAGLAQTAPLPPSIFIVGDPKQSIYRFRDADVSVLGEAARYIEGLRPEGGVRRSISRSFRSVPALLSFVNDVCRDIEKADRADAFRYDEQDQFPLDAGGVGLAGDESLGAIVAADPESCANAVAAEIHRLLAVGATVRDPGTGVARAVGPGDIAILFRTRESHRELEESLHRRGVPAYVYKGLGLFESDEIRDLLAVLWHLAEPLSNLRAAAWLRSGFVRLSDEALRRLGPPLADALVSPRPAAAAASLDAADASALTMARAASARWRQLVDLVPPAELLDMVLSDSAYAFEMRGHRFPQARENVKKIRGIVRRVQNTGYATLARIVAHLDRLAVGDEANAAIDAADAVSLMTVHAAKGLEFPIVFVVNLTRGTGGAPQPIRLVDAGDGDVSVSVGDFQSPLDEDQAASEREETKRLLYVALTRARDRLYVSAVARDGRMEPVQGSLAEVLPASLRAELGAAAEGISICWQASSGTVHAFRRCPVPADASAGGSVHVPASQTASQAPVELDFQPLPESGHVSPLPATGAGRATGQVARRESDGSMGFPSETAPDEAGSRRLRGRIVHRMLERFGLPRTSEDVAALTERARLLIRSEERDGLADLDPVVTEACDLYRALARHRGLRDLFEGGEAFFEVPFSLAVDGALVRGTIDCLVRRHPQGVEDPPEGRITVIEFKTGRPSPEHLDQVTLYLRAAGAVFPGTLVDARLAYPDRLVAV